MIVVLRSSEWDGPAPSAGDVVEHDGVQLVIIEANAGAGLGHYTLRAVPMTGRIWRWHDEPVAAPRGDDARA